jgi:hypothetical protein
MRSLFNLETGELTGMQMLASPEMMALNTPRGHAWVDGAHDQRRTLVRLVTDDFGDQHAVAVQRTPPRPADSEMQVWSWSAAALDWVASPTVALLKAQAAALVLGRFPALDAALARPVGEIALAAIASATSSEQLQAIEQQPLALQTST